MKSRKKKEYARKMERLLNTEVGLAPVGAKVRILQTRHGQLGCEGKVGYIESVRVKKI